MDNITDQFIEDLYSLKNKQIPKHVILLAKKALLDYLGVTLCGSKMNQDKLKTLFNMSNEDTSCTVIGLKKRTSYLNAVLINGISSHTAELDDGNRFAMTHPGSPIISALLPLAEINKIDGTTLLKSIIIGYEAALRLAKTIQPGHKHRGFHGTGTCGTIGAAIGSAILLDYSKQQMKNTFSAAIGSAAGMLKMIDDESELKPINAGKAAMNGALAAQLSNFKGPIDVLNGDRGFLVMATDEYDLSQLKMNDNGLWAIEGVYTKPYAACRHCHPPIEAALNLRKEYNIRPDIIKEVIVKTYEMAVKGHEHHDIYGISSAKMSIPYSVAAAIVLGIGNIDAFSTNSLKDDTINELSKKVKVCTHSEFSKLVPQKRIAEIQITTHNGIIYTERVDYPKGEPENPMSLEEIEDKFRALAAYRGKTKEEIDNIIKCVWSIEDNIESLFKLI